jgi:hypothetical protein
MRVTTPTPPLDTAAEDTSLSDSEKDEALTESLEAQIQTVTDPSDPAYIARVGVALRAYSYASAREPILTYPENAIQGIKVSKSPGSGCILNRAISHHPQRVIFLLVVLSNVIFRAQYFTTLWKHTRVISILKPGKDPALSSSCRAISLLNIIGKDFQKILLSLILSELNGRGLLRAEQFRFRLRHSTSL